ncbi:MAG: FAD-dependent oxidoreductase, partial [Candidatus Margulisiibacteriota bacterium]
MQFAIIGAGAAGMNAATILRRKIPQSIIDVFSDEAYLYYSRPRLIEVLANKTALEQIYFHTEQWYAANRISLHTETSVKKISIKNQNLIIGKEGSFKYDRLLIATGGLARVPKIEGAD